MASISKREMVKVTQVTINMYFSLKKQEFWDNLVNKALKKVASEICTISKLG